MLEEAADAGIDLIATWAYPRNAEKAARAYFDAVDSRGGRVHLVRLVCDRATLLARVGDPSRHTTEKLTDPARLGELLDGRFEPRQLPFVQEALASGERKMTSFWPRVRVRVLTDADLARFGPGARLFRNLNDPYEYAAARRDDP